MTRRAAFINLEPRYTPGSPGVVTSWALALRVARDEKEFYGHCLEGISGEADKKLAEERGLALIVFVMFERRGAWATWDVIERKWHWWPMEMRCLHCKERGVRCVRGKMVAHVAKGSRYSLECRGSGQYVGREMTDEPALEVA